MTTNHPARAHCLSSRRGPSLTGGGALHRIILILSVLFAWLGSERIVQAGAPPLPAQLQQTRFISYTPRSFSIAGERVVAATESGIRADLKLLRPHFNGLITYSATSGVEAVPAIAHELGYRAVVMGIWDPLSEVEFRNVTEAARRYPSLVTAVIVGNEGLYTGRYRQADLRQAVLRIKRECPALAVTTSEPFFLYFKKENTGLFSSLDLLMPNIHPIFEPWFKPGDPVAGVNMVLNLVGQFQATYPLPLLIKETGVPSGPATGQAGFTPEGQARFWSDLLSRFPAAANLALACFEAFDAPWKPATIGNEFPGDHATEAFWGFFTSKGEGKPVIKALPELVEPLR